LALFRRASGREHADGRWVVAGLGNPERRYAGTRHNVGAMVLDVLLSRIGGRLKRHKSGCFVAEGTMAAARAVLARPAK
jgi:peptidyl-tRNA hydrolase, PTH1 family